MRSCTLRLLQVGYWEAHTNVLRHCPAWENWGDADLGAMLVWGQEGIEICRLGQFLDCPDLILADSPSSLLGGPLERGWGPHAAPMSCPGQHRLSREDGAHHQDLPYSSQPLGSVLQPLQGVHRHLYPGMCPTSPPVHTHSCPHEPAAESRVCSALGNGWLPLPSARSKVAAAHQKAKRSGKCGSGQS